ncbi:MAG: PilZ domain-containing protein [Labilithrix sp.]|nr:PilZ domain-containing protein [Labilithrix sp.]
MASELRVTYEKASGGDRRSGAGADLSLGGLFIETAETLPVGSLLSLEIESGSTKVAVDARVLAHKSGGMSVSFIDLPNDVASTLSFIVATRTKRKGTMLGLGEAEDDVVPRYQSERRLPASASPEAAAPPLSRPATPVMEAKVDAPGAPPKYPTPPMTRAAPVSQPLPQPVPPAPPSAGAWGAPPPPSTPGPYGAPPLTAAPAEARRGGATAALVVIAVVVLLALIGGALWFVRGRAADPPRVGRAGSTPTTDGQARQALADTTQSRVLTAPSSETLAQISSCMEFARGRLVRRAFPG